MKDHLKNRVCGEVERVCFCRMANEVVIKRNFSIVAAEFELDF